MVAAQMETSALQSWKVVNTDSCIRCPYCGIEHPNSALVDLYRHCIRCQKIMREPQCLVIPEHVLGSMNCHIVILQAAYGHPENAQGAEDVTRKVQKMVCRRRRRSSGKLLGRRRSNEEDQGEELRLDTHVDLVTALGIQPVPGSCKTLRFRYYLWGRTGEVLLDERQEGFLRQSFQISSCATNVPQLKLFRATYGHPTNAKCVVDVTEQLIASVDEHGSGHYLEIPQGMNCAKVFGDPAYGVAKVLLLDYEVLGRHGQAREYEKNGRLLREMKIKTTPMIAPMILITAAYYGVSSNDRAHRLAELRAMALSNAPHPELEQEMERVLTMASSVTSLDIRDKVQERIDHGRGDVLEIGYGTNVNQLFGDPCPGNRKFFEVNYEILGLGENIVDGDTTPSGYIRNFVTKKKGTLRRAVTIEGGLEQPLRIEAQSVHPMIQITRASFGHPTDIFKTFDISDAMNIRCSRQGGKELIVESELDLIDAFGDPARGVRKALRINYTVRGICGRFKSQERNDELMHAIGLGYAPHERNTGVSGTIGFVERFCSRGQSRRHLHSHGRNPSSESVNRPNPRESESVGSGSGRTSTGNQNQTRNTPISRHGLDSRNSSSSKGSRASSRTPSSPVDRNIFSREGLPSRESNSRISRRRGSSNLL